MTRWRGIVLLLGLAGVIGVDLVEQAAGAGLLEQVDNRVVDGVPGGMSGSLQLLNTFDLIHFMYTVGSTRQVGTQVQ